MISQNEKKSDRIYLLFTGFMYFVLFCKISFHIAHSIQFTLRNPTININKY